MFELKLRPIPEVNSRHQQGTNVPVVPASAVLPTVTPSAQLRSTTPTTRAAEPTTLDVPPQAKPQRGEGSQMDVRSVSVATVVISGTDDEDSAEYIDGHEDAGELLDPLLDSDEEATKAKLKELDRLADLECVRPWTCTLLSGRSEWIWTAEKDGIRARFLATEFKGDETMYDVFARSSTPSTGRVIDYMCIIKSYHTSTADVTNAYFHVEDEEECYGTHRLNCWNSRPHWRKRFYGRRRAGTRWVEFMAERLKDQSFDRCDAAPQFLAYYELDFSFEVWHWTETGAGPGPNQPLTENPFQNLDTERSGREVRTPRA